MHGSYSPWLIMVSYSILKSNGISGKLWYVMVYYAIIGYVIMLDFGMLRCILTL